MNHEFSLGLGGTLSRLEKVGGWDELKGSPWWEPLRGRPRFQRLLEQMGLDDPTIQETVEELSPDLPDAPTERSQQGSGAGNSPTFSPRPFAHRPMRSVLHSIRRFQSGLRQSSACQVAVTYALAGVFVTDATNLT